MAVQPWSMPFIYEYECHLQGTDNNRVYIHTDVYYPTDDDGRAEGRCAIHSKSRLVTLTWGERYINHVTGERNRSSRPKINGLLMSILPHNLSRVSRRGLKQGWVWACISICWCHSTQHVASTSTVGNNVNLVQVWGQNRKGVSVFGCMVSFIVFLSSFICVTWVIL